MSGVAKPRRLSSSQAGPNYQLYKLSRFLHVGTAASVPRGYTATSPGSSAPVAPLFQTSRAEITHVAAAASPAFPHGPAFTAVALSTNDLLLRVVGECHVPVVHHVPWSKAADGDAIVGLAFDPTAQWLLVAAADGTLTLLAVHYLCCSKRQRDPSSGLSSSSSSSSSESDSGAPSYTGNNSNNSSNGGGLVHTLKQYVDPTELRNLNRLSPGRPHVIRPARRAPRQATCCVWWKPRDRSGDYGVVGTAAGTLCVVNLATGDDVLTVRVRAAVARLTLVADPAGAYRYLLVHTAAGCVRLLLERELASGAVETLVAAAQALSAPGSPFQPQPLAHLGPDADIALQHTNFGPVVRVMRNYEYIKRRTPDPRLR